MSFAKFRDGLLGPTIILFAICLVITFALAAVYQVTNPLIQLGDVKAADDARSEVLPGADAFTQITDTALPDGVLEVYRADNGAGYVVKSQAKGFDGQVTFMIGISDVGEVTGINMFEHNETPGLGTKVADESYLKQYFGDADPLVVDSITGATKTSNALKNSLLVAKDAYNAVKGAE